MEFNFDSLFLDQTNIDCRCHTFGAPGAADGVTITTTDGIVRCEARASHSKKFPIMVRYLSK